MKIFKVIKEKIIEDFKYYEFNKIDILDRLSNLLIEKENELTK
jgi:hypothetical protein